MRRGIWLGLSALVILVSLMAACGQAPPQPTAIGQAAVATPTEAPASPTPEPTATSTPEPTPEPSATPTPPPSPTVEPTPTRAVTQTRPIAVVVENEPRARPQTGLVDADVVYEAVAEFNLTRFVPIYVDSSPEVVGSVRSARAYHGAIAAEYEAGLAHCLDVPSLASVLAATKAVNMDGCKVTGPAGFWRDSKRAMPHNLYVSVPTLRKAAGGQGTYGGFDKRRPWPDSGDKVGRISFVYPEEHPVVWRYDQSRGEYLRWQDGAPHLDVSGRQLAFKSVVVQQVAVRHSVYWGESGYHELTLTGSGEAVLYSNGRKRTATWRRDGLADPTRYFDAQGVEIPLPPGKVFVQLVGMGTAITEAQ